MEWFKQHVDAVIVIGAILTLVLWMNTRFNELEKNLSEMNKEIAIIKTVLVMKNVMPIELGNRKEENEIEKG